MGLTSPGIPEKKNVYAVNFISSPGSGKTPCWKPRPKPEKRIQLMVLEGDIATTRDADRISKHGVPAVQLLTEGSCHLDASLIFRALEANPLEDVDFFLSRMWGIVCPSDMIWEKLPSCPAFGP